MSFARVSARGFRRGEEQMAAVVVYVTCGSKDEAERIGRAVVEARLAACANVWPPIASIYWWQGKMETAGEHALILKTRQELVQDVVAEVGRRHSYECPCVVALPILDGNPDYLAWIAAETRKGDGP
jgi:periplasmic divalent cation tolerance protein